MVSNAIPIISYIDKALSKETRRTRNDYYKDFQLSIRVSPDGLSFNILDLERNRHLALVSYLLQEIPDFDELVKELNSIFNEHELLQRYYASTRVLLETPKSTLVPSALFEKSRVNDYLKFNHIINRREEAGYDQMNNLEAFNLYAIPIKLKEFFKTKFARFKMLHYLSPLIDLLLLLTKNQPATDKVYVNVRNNVFDLIYIDKGKLIFANSFSYRTPEDFAYFLLYSMEQLQLNPEEVQLILLGEIDKSSKLYEIIYRYIRHINFIRRNEFFKYSYVFDELPDWHFYNLLNLAQCEL